MHQILLMSLVFLWSVGVVLAGDYTMSLDATQDAELLRLTLKENADRADPAIKNIPNERFCEDDPKTCAKPDPQAFLVWWTGTHLSSTMSQQKAAAALTVKQECEKDFDVNCQAIVAKSQGK